MRFLPVLVALIIVLVGTVYAFVRDDDYESTAQLALVPTSKDATDIADLLSSFASAGAIGTYVELYASEDTRKSADDPPVTITVRAVPDSRIIRVTARGPESEVTSSLNRILAAGRSQETKLNDAWGTTVIQQPTIPERSRPGRGLVLLATLLLAILGGVFTSVLVRRAESAPSPRTPSGGAPAAAS